jgi:anthranilate synthase component 2
MTIRLLLIDNYDSFTYNLFQYLSELGARVDVRRNDAVTLDEIEAARPDGLVLSPGPGRPEDAGVCIDTVHRFAGRLPILGVCLGHQAIAAAYGGDVVEAPELRHGKTSPILHSGDGLYCGLSSPFEAVRYHSLVADEVTLPHCLVVDSRAPDGTIMGVRHRELPVFGVQFHPESIVTAGGKDLLQNFLDVVTTKAVTASVETPRLHSPSIAVAVPAARR